MIAAVLAGSLARAEDWTTNDGQIYHAVKVVSHDDAYVTVLYSDGGARIPLRTLASDLQKRFNYDAAKAAAQEASMVAADKREREAVLAQQTAARQAAQVPAPAVQPQSPSQPVIMHGPAAPASKKPPVDVVANGVKIDEDKKALEDIEIDIRDAKRDERRDWEYSGYHYDNTGTVHPNSVGDTPQDRLTRLEKKKKELEAEIQELQAQDAAAGQPST